MAACWCSFLFIYNLSATYFNSFMSAFYFIIVCSLRWLSPKAQIHKLLIFMSCSYHLTGFLQLQKILGIICRKSQVLIKIDFKAFMKITN